LGPNAEEEEYLGGLDREEMGSAAGTVIAAPPDDSPPKLLDDLVSRIPAATRAALGDLLRARFTRVRRLRDGELR